MADAARCRSLTIFFVAFASGAVVMSFEILGVRVLAPDFGSSVYVWGSVISVLLGGLAAGYFLGGYLADRLGTFAWLAAVLCAAATLIVTFPCYGRAVSNWFFDHIESIPAGALLTSLCLFSLPTLFLGMVSPYSVRLLVRDAARVGRGAGSIYAVSTAGSILGTLGTSFYLILWMGVSAAITLLGCVLWALAAVATLQHMADRSPGRPPGEAEH